MIACEAEPGAAAALRRNLRGDHRAKAVEIDGWRALLAYIPPKERRGLVLIDPPFEERDEYSRLATALTEAHRKWPGGIYVAWYPIKSERDVAGFRRRLGRAAGDMLRAELVLAAPAETTRLRGTGLIICNPPWTLENEVKIMLPALGRGAPPGRQKPGRYRADWRLKAAGATPQPLSSRPALVFTDETGFDVPPP